MNNGCDDLPFCSLSSVLFATLLLHETPPIEQLGRYTASDALHSNHERTVAWLRRQPGMKLRQMIMKTSFAACVVVALVIYLFTFSHISQRLRAIAIHPLNAVIQFQRPLELTWGLSSHQAESDETPAARLLIDKIKEAARLASGPSSESSNGDDDDITPEEREAWSRQNPCLSRSELLPMYDDRKYVNKLPPNPVWEEVLTEYSKLHRTCTKKVGNFSDYFLTGNVSTGCQFVIADTSMGAGLGNKVVAMASSLLFAIITQRVVLIPSATEVPYTTCQPFLGSSWTLDSDTFPVPHFVRRSEFLGSPWTSDTEFFELIDRKEAEEATIILETSEQGAALHSPSLKIVDAVAVINQEYQPSGRFYCPVEQAFYSEVTWMYLAGCIYSIPKLFSSPSFRSTLEDLFPDKVVLTRLLRSVFLPGDDVWDRVLSINREQYAGADRRVGIQVRFTSGEGQYLKMNELVNERIVSCAQQHAILPHVNSTLHSPDSIRSLANRENSSSTVPPKPVVKVFVASLYLGMVQHLSTTYQGMELEEELSLVQISERQFQTYSLEEDKQALAEILLLSLSDQLLLTPCSTFGGLAQIYGALTPWLIEMREDPVGKQRLSGCERGQSVDLCNMATEKIYGCPHNPGVNGKAIAQLVPYIEDCLSIDEPFGLQLITTFRS